ncbi:MAG: class I SAM-dependent methyltransferase [Gammaproteobacteria bacterium]
MLRKNAAKNIGTRVWYVLRARKRVSLRPMRKKHRTVADWLATPLGALTTSTETMIAERAMEKMFGDVAVQLGVWGEPDLFLQHSKTRLSLLAAPYPSDGVDLVCAPSSLALASDSVDSVILPHTLELSERPRETLREVQRVLVGDGQVVLMCFDPHSLWGMCKRLGRIPSREAAPLPIRRLFDWLTLLGLEPVHWERYLYVPPFNHEAVARRADAFARVGDTLWPFASGAFLVVAKKRVYTGMPKPHRRTRRLRVVPPLSEPITSSAA